MFLCANSRNGAAFAPDYRKELSPTHTDTRIIFVCVVFAKDFEFCQLCFIKWKIYIAGDYRLGYLRLIDLTVRSPPPDAIMPPDPRRQGIFDLRKLGSLDRARAKISPSPFMNTFWHHTLHKSSPEEQFHLCQCNVIDSLFGVMYLISSPSTQRSG